MTSSRDRSQSSRPGAQRPVDPAPGALSPGVGGGSGAGEAIERWERNRELGRNRFILLRGAAGWGVPAALVAVGYKLVQEQGFNSSPVLTHDLRVAIIVSFIVFPFAGSLLGRWLWDTGEAHYRTLVRRTRNDENRE
jgi:hypothetical protein